MQGLICNLYLLRSPQRIRYLKTAGDDRLYLILIDVYNARGRVLGLEFENFGSKRFTIAILTSTIFRDDFKTFLRTWRAIHLLCCTYPSEPFENEAFWGVDFHSDLYVFV